MLLLDSRWNMLSNELCESIMAMNNYITFVAVISEKGRVEESCNRNCIIEKLPRIRREMFFMENALRHRMRTEFDDEFGQVGFTYVERAKRGLLSFPMGQQLLLVSFFRTRVNSLDLAKRITRLLGKYKKKLKNNSQVLVVQ